MSAISYIEMVQLVEILPFLLKEINFCPSMDK